MIDEGDTCKGQLSCSHAEQAAAAWETSSTIKQPQLKRLPEFGVWQAGQLLVRDVIFGAFLLLTFCLYLRATVPELCKIGPPSPSTNSSTWSSSAAASQWPSSFKLICGHITNSSAGSTQNKILGSSFSRHLGSDKILGVGVARSSSSWNRVHSAAAAPGQSVEVLPLRIAGFLLAVFAAAVSKVVGASLFVVKVLFAFFAWGFLTGDLFHMIIPPLRLALVMPMLLPMPYPNLTRLLRMGRKPGAQSGAEQQQRHVEDTSCQASNLSSTTQQRSNTSYIAWYRPSFWWQYPRFRTANIIVQRLLPPIAAAFSVGHIGERYFELTALRYWPIIYQYMYLGWMAWMLVVPFKVHLFVNFAEWLIIYSTAVRVRMVYYKSPLVCTTHIVHLLASLLFVILLPTAGVAWLERGHRVRYQQASSLVGMHGSTADNAANSGEPAAQQQQQQERDGSSKQQCSKQVSVEGPAAASPAADKLLKHGSLIRRRVQQLQHQQLNGSNSNVSSNSAHGAPKAAAVSVSPATPATAADSPNNTAAAAGGCSQGVSRPPTVPPPASAAPSASASSVSGNGKRRASTNSMPKVAYNHPSSRRFSVGANHGALVNDQLLAEINSSLQLAATARQQTKSSSNGTSSKVPMTIDQFMRHKAPPLAGASEDVPLAMYQEYRSSAAPSAVHIEDEAKVASTAAACSPAVYNTPSTASVAPSATVEVQSAATMAFSSGKPAPGLFIVPELAPAIKSLIGDEQAAAVFAAAAAGATAHGGQHAAVMPYYTSRAPKQCWNVGLQLA